ncbi:hypothetical protein [Carboxylicivirga linearis]|uniref:Uncharacterized protein n=1 Tax=Carboxylicivirga linearis TaxID=1628157 RepID=A0ABS5JZR1_9BACT|nr:hypothetical protein [Carboxylicivirga linearis]MBS2100295.1 hypothetical protein [Carboxylicivirga linearis]
MNVIEKEAEQFFFRLYNSGMVNNLENLKSIITTKLFDFNRDRDKLDFLKIIREETIKDKEEHAKGCNGNCGYEKEREIGIFVIDQEIDDINRFYTYEPKNKDKFDAEEESKLHIKLNEIIEKLERQGCGQEVIFNEIEELKNHFNLGKTNWFQLLKGKLFDLSNKTLEKAVIKEIYEFLSDGYDAAVKIIEN